MQEAAEKFRKRKNKVFSEAKKLAKEAGIELDPFVFVECTREIDEKRIRRLLDEAHTLGLQTLVVLDDLITKSNDPFIQELFTAGRHKNASTVTLNQRIYTSKSRTQRLNCQYFVVWDFGDVQEFRMLARQISPERWRDLVEAYKNATSKKYGYIIIDQNVRRSSDPSHKLLRVRDSGLDRVIPELSDL